MREGTRSEEGDEAGGRGVREGDEAGGRGVREGNLRRALEPDHDMLITSPSVSVTWCCLNNDSSAACHHPQCEQCRQNE